MIDPTNKNDVENMLNCVEETNHPAFRELQQKVRDSRYEFSNKGVENTLRSYGLLDELKNVNPIVLEVIEK